jgi:hypothetical protein
MTLGDGYKPAVYLGRSTAPRRKVFGLIIWSSSVARYNMARQQIDVLETQWSKEQDLIAGWIATEEIYPCRDKSTAAHNEYTSFAFYQVILVV